MSLIAGYNDPIYIQWNEDEHGNLVNVEMPPEQHLVFDNKITLLQIPNVLQRVQIREYNNETPPVKVNTTDFTEIHDKKTALGPYNFRVNYENGMIFFHPDRNGTYITITRYFGRGVIYYPASRIYTKAGEGTIEQTMQDIVDSQTRKFIFSQDEPPIDPSEYPEGTVWFVYEDI